MSETMERVILIGLRDGQSEFEWLEFVELVKAAGAMEVGRVIQTKDRPDPALFIGSGKAEELAALVADTAADLVVSIQELSPVQIRNLEQITKARVIDRTALILDIFAQRAQTREGKLQVELAQLNYLLPRLGSSGEEYSRLGGGIGTRGPGETKLEVDRRRIRDRLVELRRELENVAKHRLIQRKQRDKQEIPTIALIGYTNAGKSTLFNRLTTEQVSARNRLFDTLDPVARSLVLPDNQKVVFLDTVGFVSNLPHQLVAAFKSTLEETVRSSLLLHVMDISNPDLEQQYESVRQVLDELDAQSRPLIHVLNKADVLGSPAEMARLAERWSGIAVSAKTGAGIPELIEAIQRQLALGVQTYEMLLPFGEASRLNLVHQYGKVLEEEYTAEGIRLVARMDAILAAKVINDNCEVRSVK